MEALLQATSGAGGAGEDLSEGRMRQDLWAMVRAQGAVQFIGHIIGVLSDARKIVAVQAKSNVSGKTRQVSETQPYLNFGFPRHPSFGQSIFLAFQARLKNPCLLHLVDL